MKSLILAVVCLDALTGVCENSATKSCACVGEPVPLCQGPTWEEAGWGPYQFPRAFVLGEGRVVCSVHMVGAA